MFTLTKKGNILEIKEPRNSTVRDINNTYITESRLFQSKEEVEEYKKFLHKINCKLDIYYSKKIRGKATLEYEVEIAEGDL